ncbi:alpha/beta fold hydrolase [Micromonospora sp. NPDC050276]|uniref:alpha/beta fold hydrolase n=1 Tax=Micromonospora sp. NPDC050276 TaxID=3364278 RepID=UPI0037A1293A
MATFVLVPGFWLGAWAWREVTLALRSQGHEVYPMTLTGVAERDHLAGPEVGLDTHTTDIVRLIEVEDLHDVLLVGHSGGGMPVAQAADRVPDRIARVVYVESGPLPDGTAQFDTVPPQEQQRLRAAIGTGHLLPPPAWDPPPTRRTWPAWTSRRWRCCAPGPPRSRCGPPPTRYAAPVGARCRPRWSPAPSRSAWCGR